MPIPTNSCSDGPLIWGSKARPYLLAIYKDKEIPKGLQNFIENLDQMCYNVGSRLDAPKDVAFAVFAWLMLSPNCARGDIYGPDAQ